MGRLTISAHTTLLANALRREILQQVERGGGCTLAEVVRRVSATQATICYHLRTLKRAGLIYSYRQGKTAVYVVNRARLKQLALPLGAGLSGGRTEKDETRRTSDLTGLRPVTPDTALWNIGLESSRMTTSQCCSTDYFCACSST